MKIAEIIKIADKMATIVFKLSSYVMVFLMCLVYLFEPEIFNQAETNELVLVCMLVIVGVTIDK